MKDLSNRKMAPIIAALMLTSLSIPLAACATINGQESASQYVTDASLTTKVRANIIKDQSLKGFEIGVETLHRTVELSGFVDTPRQKQQAAIIAEAVPGVKSVKNNIIVHRRVNSG